MEDHVDRLVHVYLLNHVVVAEDEIVVTQVLEVLERARLEVVDADDAKPLAEQVFAEVGTEESGSAGDDGSGHFEDVSRGLGPNPEALTNS